MKLTYRTKVFKVLPYDIKLKPKYILIWHPTNTVYKDTIAFVSKDIYEANIKDSDRVNWVAFRQKKL